MESNSPEYTILIVDDESISRDVLEGHLASEGYNIIHARDGFQALRRFERHRADLIILDVMMPHMDGFEVCRRIKSDKRWRNIPIILVTAFWDQEQMDRGIEAGAESFLPKPLNGDELRSQVRLLLQPME
jgi:two-component system, sensor histidine kinase and response regulator